MNDLAKRAVACKHWRWMPGMRLIHPTYGLTRVPVVDGDRGVWVVKEKVRALEYLHTRLFNEIEGCLPDLADPATLGCLLALVRRTYFDTSVFVRPDYGGRWVFHALDPEVPQISAPTEAHALVVALETAP